MAPYPTGTCANCTNHGVLKYARRTMCTRYKCQKAATAERVARLADGGGDDAVVPTYCFEIKEVIGMRFADPERLVGKKRRNELAAAETSLCYLTRGKFGEDQNDDGFIDTRWVELEELYDKRALRRASSATATSRSLATCARSTCIRGRGRRRRASCGCGRRRCRRRRARRRRRRWSMRSHS